MVEQAELAHAGLTDRFDAILPADTVRALKPRREPYELATRTFSARTRDVTPVAAHAWDIAGALAARVPHSLRHPSGRAAQAGDPESGLVGADLGEIADRILAN